MAVEVLPLFPPFGVSSMSTCSALAVVTAFLSSALRNARGRIVQISPARQPCRFPSTALSCASKLFAAFAGRHRFPIWKSFFFFFFFFGCDLFWLSRAI